jgi:hypothetical protein
MSLFTMTFDTSDSLECDPPKQSPVHPQPSLPLSPLQELENMLNQQLPPNKVKKKHPHRHPLTPVVKPQHRQTIVFSSSSDTDAAIESVTIAEAQRNPEPEPVPESEQPTQDEGPPAEPGPEAPAPYDEMPRAPRTLHTKSSIDRCSDSQKATIGDQFRGVSDPVLIARLNSQLRRLRGVALPPDLIPYRILRISSLTLKGQRTEFSLVRDGEVILYSKIKTRAATEAVHISKAKNDFHFSSEASQAALLASRDFRAFSLRFRTRYGRELIVIRYEPHGLQYAPRTVRLFLADPPDGVPAELASRQPVITAVGTWILDLSGRIGKRSVKNCVLEDQTGREVLSVMKIRSKEFVIETRPGMSELCVFAVGISSCLCKL